MKAMGGNGYTHKKGRKKEHHPATNRKCPLNPTDR